MEEYVDFSQKNSRAPKGVLNPKDLTKSLVRESKEISIPLYIRRPISGLDQKMVPQLLKSGLALKHTGKVQDLGWLETL